MDVKMNGAELRAEDIRRHLRHRELELRVFRSIDSTNTALKALAADGAEAGLALIAGRQTAGRGRMGRSFYSPAGTGLYMSLLLRPELPAAKALQLTACAAAAAAETIEEMSGRGVGIKWVNDLTIDGRKVCGILCESAADARTGRLRYAVVGLGINLFPPEGGFPAELRDIAGAVFEGEPSEELRCRMAAGVLDRLWEAASEPDAPAVFESYRRRCWLLGREIDLIAPGRAPERALAVGLNEDYSLRVRLPDGTLRDVLSGEVSVRTA